MRLVMTLLVRDEEDVLASHLDYHLSQGVDFVVATDNGSQDTTVAILQDYARRGVLRLIQEPDDTYAQGRWVTRMARLAAAEHDADWVIHSDADEFWWPRSGDLSSSLAAVPPSAAWVEVPRTDFLPLPEEGTGEAAPEPRGGSGPSYERPFYERMTVREARSLNALGRPLPPKVCHRADPEAVVEQGNHRVELSVPGGGAALRPLEIFHFPLRSYRQFANKIAKGGAAYERNRELPPEMGSTWRHLYRELGAGRLKEHFDSRALGPEAVAAGLAEGSLVRDTRLRDHLRRLATGRREAAS